MYPNTNESNVLSGNLLFTTFICSKNGYLHKYHQPQLYVAIHYVWLLVIISTTGPKVPFAKKKLALTWPHRCEAGELQLSIADSPTTSYRHFQTGVPDLH